VGAGVAVVAGVAAGVADGRGVGDGERVGVAVDEGDEPPTVVPIITRPKSVVQYEP
jgi:hypothetical protein